MLGFSFQRFQLMFQNQWSGSSSTITGNSSIIMLMEVELRASQLKIETYLMTRTALRQTPFLGPTTGSSSCRQSLMSPLNFLPGLLLTLLRNCSNELKGSTCIQRRYFLIGMIDKCLSFFIFLLISIFTPFPVELFVLPIVAIRKGDRGR